MGWGIAAIVLLAAVLPLSGAYDRARTGHGRELFVMILTACIILGVTFAIVCTIQQAPESPD